MVENAALLRFQALTVPAWFCGVGDTEREFVRCATDEAAVKWDRKEKAAAGRTRENDHLPT
jgi:hypothetical protein